MVVSNLAIGITRGFGLKFFISLSGTLPYIDRWYCTEDRLRLGLGRNWYSVRNVPQQATVMLIIVQYAP